METFTYNIFDTENFNDDEDFGSIINGMSDSTTLSTLIDDIKSFKYGDDLGCETLNT